MFDCNSFNIKNTRVVTDLDDGINDPAISILSNGDLILRNTVVEVKKTSNKQRSTCLYIWCPTAD